MITKELLAKVEEAAEAITDVQKRSETLQEQLDGIDKNAIAKASEAGSKAMEEVQAIHVKLDAHKKAQEEMEKMILRPSNGTVEDEVAKEYEVAFNNFLRSGELMDKDLHEKFSKEISEKICKDTRDPQKLAVFKDMVSGINPQGGYWVRPERLSQVISRIFETSPVRSVANIITTTTNEVEIIIDDEEAGAALSVGELDPRPITGTPEIGLLKIPVHELSAQPRATQRMIDDAGFDLEGWLMGKVSRKIGRQENTQFVVGTSAGEAQGFLTLPDWTTPEVYERGAIEQIPTGNATDITADGVIDLQCALIEDYQARAVFMMKRKTFCEIMKLKDDQGQYLLNPRILREGSERILLGNQVILANDMPVIAAAALPLIYGDFSLGYTIVDRFGIRVLRDPFTDKPFTLFYTTKRMGAAVTSFDSLKIQVVGV